MKAGFFHFCVSVCVADPGSCAWSVVMKVDSRPGCDGVLVHVCGTFFFPFGKNLSQDRKGTGVA